MKPHGGFKLPIGFDADETGGGRGCDAAEKCRNGGGPDGGGGTRNLEVFRNPQNLGFSPRRLVSSARKLGLRFVVCAHLADSLARLASSPSVEVSNFPLGLMPTRQVEDAAAMQPRVGCRVRD